MRAFGRERGQTQMIPYTNILKGLMAQDGEEGEPDVGCGEVGLGEWEQMCLMEHCAYMIKCWPVQTKTNR